MYPRYIRKIVEDALVDTPVVSILGPRQVGKSTLALQLGEGRQYITLDDENLLKLATNDASGFIQSLDPFVVIDEVQRAPNLMLAIKKSVDEDRRPGRFLLTGSANLTLMKQAHDSLAGRHEPIHLLPITAQEIKATPVSNTFLSALLSKRISAKANAFPGSLQELMSIVVKGGYPVPLSRSTKRAHKWFSVYLDDIVNRDLVYIDEIRNPDALLRLLKLCAHQTGSLLEFQSLAVSIGISVPTVKNYLETLQKLFLIRLIPGWSPNKGKRLVKAPKLHLVDSGMICALAGLTEDDWLARSDLFGHVIESFVVQQIIAQIAWLDEDVNCFHFRDKNRQEVDLVLEKGNAVWGIEVKRASQISDRDLKGLKAFAQMQGKRWQGGVIFYSGEHILPTNLDNVYAVPLAALWDGL